MCRDPGLNQGPSDLQSDALPTELSRHVKMTALNRDSTRDLQIVLNLRAKIKNTRKILCRDPGLNQGPSDLQSDALPTELSRHVKMNALNRY